jgi:hypothetical protein
VENDLISPEMPMLKIAWLPGQFALGITLLDDHTPKNKQRVRGIDNRQIVIAGFIERQDLH